MADQQKRLDTWTRVAGKRALPTREEGRRAFAAVAPDRIPRYVKVNKAWMVMMVRQGIVPADRGRTILAALDAVDLDEMIETYDERFDKPILQLERYLSDKAGAHASDVMAGRTLPPPVYRMALREKIVPLIAAGLDLRGTLLDHAARHTGAVMPGYTHLSHAQPMTYGHYLLGIHDAVARALRQIEGAYDSTNRCDMGCGALAGTSFDIDRPLLADLLVFDGLIEHSNDCVAATDFAVDLGAAVINLLIPLTRAADEMDTWTTFEMDMLEISDAIGATSSMMPQKKNATICEHLRWRLGVVLGCFTEITTGAHATPYGDVMEVMFVPKTAERIAEHGAWACRRMAVLVENMTAKPDVMLRHAREGFSTVSELANVLFRERGTPWRVAHAIVAGVVRRLVDAGQTACDITTYLVDEVAAAVTGEPAGLTADQIAAAIDPVTFVEAHDSQGGVAPKETDRMIAARRDDLAADRERHDRRLAALDDADRRLDDAVAELTA